MQCYVNEDFYKSTYLSGKEAVIATAFSFYAREASALLKQYTADKVDETDIPECVKLCCCELAELLFQDAQTRTETGGVSSESVQGWSKSYESTEVRQAALQRNVKTCIYKWLGVTGLLYRGC